MNLEKRLAELTLSRLRSLVLSNTAELHTKIEQLSNRTRELEDALAKLHSGTSDEPHPLLRQELLMLKLPPGVHTTSDLEMKRAEDIVADAFGTLQIADDGGGAFFGGTAGSEFYLGDSEVRGSPHIPCLRLIICRMKRRKLLLVTIPIFLWIS
jgi:hypothetical protein